MIAIYARVSGKNDKYKDDKDIPSIKNQINFGIQFATENNLKYIVYQDIKISGTLFNERKGLQNLISDIEENKIDSVWYYDQSRLERSPQIRIILNSIFSENQINLYENGKAIDLNDSEQMLMSDLKSIVNQYYTKQSVNKIKKAKVQNAIEGKANGMVPFGYTTDEKKNIIIDEIESELVKEIFNRYIAGQGGKTIAKVFDAKKIPHKRKSSMWHENTIRGILQNPIYKGIRLYKGIEYKAPAIVSVEVWERANLARKENKSFTGKANEYKYLFKGFVKCTCGRNFVGKTKKNPKQGNFYSCSSRLTPVSCGQKPINLPLFESIVFQYIIGMLRRELSQISESEINSKIDSEKDKIKELKSELSKEKKKQENLIISVSNGLLSDSDISSQINKIKRKQSDLTALIRNAENLLISLVEAKENNPKQKDFEWWKLHESMSFDDKRKLLVDNNVRITLQDYKDVKAIQIEVKTLLRGTREDFFYLKNTSGKSFYFGHSIDNLIKHPKEKLSNFFE